MSTKSGDKMTPIISVEVIENKILLIRGEKIMLDSDLAGLFGVETKNLNKAVKRHAERFPPEFMFQLNYQELSALRFQIGTLKPLNSLDKSKLMAQVNHDILVLSKQLILIQKNAPAAILTALLPVIHSSL